jgi:2-dehydro-3-deoxyphosphogluconate aldolase/(4S)-4-hydroxy-2-oxoglutarate aldolase
MKKEKVRALIEEIGIVPVVRCASPEEARMAAQAVAKGGIPIVEITMTVPGALEVILELAKAMPKSLVGAGTVLNKKMAEKCADAGAQFLVTPGFTKPVVTAARKMDLVVMAGALTPTEVMAAWEAGVDLVKIFPCANVGGASYIKALKGPFPEVPLVPTGGVNLETAVGYIQAGSAALGIGGELVSRKALQERTPEVISELATRYVETVKEARKQMAAKLEKAASAR